jgi:hypothetical protein
MDSAGGCHSTSGSRYGTSASTPSWSKARTASRVRSTFSCDISRAVSRATTMLRSLRRTSRLAAGAGSSGVIPFAEANAAENGA